MYLVFSTSLHPDSRSRILARSAARILAESAGEDSCELVDLSELSLPACDGYQCYEDATVQQLSDKIAAASGVLIASPVYNYDLSSSAKNLIELTGSAWTNKVVGFLCASGGESSYMAPMGLANSLMLDFRSLILPQFVYVTDAVFRGNEIDQPEVVDRIRQLVGQLIRVAAIAG